MAIDLIQNEKAAKEKRKQFQIVLKKSNHANIIKQLPQIHKTVFEKIDCLDCANCCKNYSPRFKMPDIKRIAKYLRMKESAFIDQYLKVDEDDDYVLQEHPCSFLAPDNTCVIYDVRPRDCARYPYTDEDVLVRQIGLTLKNTAVCPAAFEVVATLEKLQMKP